MRTYLAAVRRRLRRRGGSSSLPVSLILLAASALLVATGCGGKNSVAPPKADPSAPSSVISSPAEGAFLQAGTTADMTITVEGQVCDSTNRVKSLVLNGSPVTLTGSGACRSFGTDLKSTWGLNVLHGFIENDIGNEVALVQAYLRSGDYFPPPSASKASRRGSAASAAVSGIPDALRVRLGQAALDDGDRSDPDDLVTVIDRALADAQPALNTLLNNQLPDPLYDTVKTTAYECLLQTRHNRDGIIVSITGKVTVGVITVKDLTISDGKVVVDLTAPSMTWPLSVTGYQDNGCLGEVSAHTDATIRVASSKIRATFLVDPSGDLLLGTVDVTPGDVTIDLNTDGLLGWFDGLISQVLTSVTNVAIDLTVEIWNSVGKEEVGPLIHDFFLMNVFSAGDLSVDSIPGVVVMTHFETDQVDVKEGFIDYGVSGTAYPAVYAKTPEQLAAGTPLGPSALPSFDGMEGSLGMGIKNDFLNQILWAYWAGGAFDSHGSTDAVVTAMNNAIPGPGVKVTSIEMTLPPVVMPGATESQLKIGVGGVVLSVDVEQSSPSLFEGQPVITATVPVSVHLAVFYTVTFGVTADGRLKAAVSDNPEVNVQVVSGVRTTPIIGLESLVATATSTVLANRIGDISRSIALPKFAFDHTTWYLADGALEETEGYLRIVGSVGVK